MDEFDKSTDSKEQKKMDSSYDRNKLVGKQDDSFINFSHYNSENDLRRRTVYMQKNFVDNMQNNNKNVALNKEDDEVESFNLSHSQDSNFQDQTNGHSNVKKLVNEPSITIDFTPSNQLGLQNIVEINRHRYSLEKMNSVEINNSPMSKSKYLTPSKYSKNFPLRWASIKIQRSDTIDTSSIRHMSHTYNNEQQNQGDLLEQSNMIYQQRSDYVKNNFLKRLCFVVRFIRKMKESVWLLILILISYLFQLISFDMQLANDLISFQTLNIINIQLNILIEEKYIDLINDKSFQIFRNKKSGFSSPFKGLLQKIKVFESDSKGLMLFKILEFFIILFQLLWIPLQISFQVELNRVFKLFLVDISSFIFVIAIFLRFNSTIYIEGNVVKDRVVIASYYLKESFIVDFITTLALIIQDQSSFSEIQYIFILRIPQILSLEKNIKSTLLTKQQFIKTIYFQFSLINTLKFKLMLFKNILFKIKIWYIFSIKSVLFLWQYLYQFNFYVNIRSQKYITHYELIKLISFLLFVAHFCACGFYFVGTNSGRQNWLIKFNFQDEPWFTIYIACLYFSIITMNTVGYGDLTPQNTSERIYVLIMIVISCGIFGYSINTIGEIIRASQQSYESFKLQQKEILNYLDQRQVSKQLTIKVIRQLEYITSQECFSQGEYVLEKLNQSIQEEVKMEYFGKIILNNILFKRMFSREFLEKLCLKMKDINLYPNEILEKMGQQPKRIYFIYKGVINQVFESGTDKSIQQFNVGNMIGLHNFFCGLPYECTLKSQNVTSLIFCEYTDFIELLHQFPDDNWFFKNFVNFLQEQFCLLRDCIQQDIQRDFLGQKCHCCKQFTHESFNCPSLTIVPNKSIIIQRHIFSAQQKRSFQARKKNKQTCLANLFEIKLSLKKCRLDQILNFQTIEDLDLALLKQDTEQLYHLDDKLFFQTIPLLKYQNQEIQRKASLTLSQNQDEEDMDDNENLCDEEIDEKETMNINSETSSALIKRSDKQVIFEQLKKKNEEQINKYKECDQQQQKRSSVILVAPLIDSKRGTSLEEQLQYLMQQDQPNQIKLFFISFQDNEVFGRNQKVQKKVVNNNTDKNSSNPDITSSKNVSSTKDFPKVQTYDSNLFNNISSKMLVSSNNVKMTNSSNYVHYQRKMNQKKQVNNISTNQLQTNSSKMLVENGSQLQRINKQTQNMNQSLGTTIHNQSTFYTQTKYEHTMNTIPLENMNTFENQLDRYKEYKIYFPNYNVEKVLNGMRKKLIYYQKISRMKKYKEEPLIINRKGQRSFGDSLSRSARTPQLMAVMQQIINQKNPSSNIDIVKNQS